MRRILALRVPDDVAGLALPNSLGARLRVGTLVAAVVQKHNHLVVPADPSLPHTAWKARVAAAVERIVAQEFDKVVLARRIDISANRAKGCTSASLPHTNG